MGSTPTFYIEGDNKDDYMVIEGLSASEAACYFDVFYGKEPKHIRKLAHAWDFSEPHKCFKVSIPDGARCTPRKEEWV